MSQAPPPLETWWGFAAYLRVPDDLARHWWAALYRARWSEAAELRHHLVLHAAVPLAHQTASPTQLAKVLHNLAKEGLLTQRKANTLLEYVLQCTDCNGQWIQR